MANPVYFAIIFLVCSKTWFVAGTLNFNSVNYVAVKDQLRWTNKAAALGPGLLCSIGQCAVACNRLSTECRGFAYQQTSSTEEGTGHCQLVSLVSNGTTTMVSILRNHQLYLIPVFADLCVGRTGLCLRTGTFNTTVSSFAGTAADTTADEKWPVTSMKIFNGFIVCDVLYKLYCR